MGCSSSKTAKIALEPSPLPQNENELVKKDTVTEAIQTHEQVFEHSDLVLTYPNGGKTAELLPTDVGAPVEPEILDDPLHGIDITVPLECEEVSMKNGVTYRGEWRNGKQHGLGEQRQPDGVVYTGQFVDGHIHGIGRLVRPDGCKYEGQFVQGRAETSTRVGVYTFPNGSKYIGHWKLDRRDGEGREIMGDGSQYCGQFSNGHKSGHGVMTASNGDVYEGNFENGEMSGLGKYTWPDGRIYDGNWSASRMNGNGTFFFVDGRRYEGQFEDSKMQGEGRLTWPDGACYVGQFRNGLPHGEGKQAPSSGTPAPLALWNHGVRVKWIETPGQDKPADTTEHSTMDAKS